MSTSDNKRKGSTNTGSKDRKKNSNNTKGSSPSNGNTDHGFDVANWNLRSPLIHPMGVLMASLLNDAASCSSEFQLPKEFTGCVDIYPEELIYQPFEVRDSIFASAVSNWNTDLERNLTENIMEEIQSRMDNDKLIGYESIDEISLMVEAEKHIISTSSNVRGKLDFVMTKKNVNETKRSVVMIVEFNIGHGIWWQKMDQMLKYVKKLCEATEDDNDIAFNQNQPILLTIVTVNKREKKSKCSTIPEDTDIHSDVAANKIDNTDIQFIDRKVAATPDVHGTNTNSLEDGASGEAPLEVRFGVFLCVRRPGVEYRIALLWRKETLDVNDASIQFGKILYAAELCAFLREQFAATFMEPIEGKEALYQYLGPNCCRIGESVSIQMSVFL